MFERIQFDLDSLLGDTAASDFKGIEYLNCFEYTLWQLMRQNGISDYRAALHTTAFVTESKALSSQFGRLAIKNLEVLAVNLKRFYGVTLVSYSQGATENQSTNSVTGEGSFYWYIREAIQAGRFVYALYNHFYDTINDPGQARKKNTYHSTLLTGYDDDRQEYIALIDGRYNIGYTDFQQIYAHFQRRAHWIHPWILFYLTPPEMKIVAADAFQGELYFDLEKTVHDWYRESETFGMVADEVMEYFSQTSNCLKDERARELYRVRIFFYRMRLGCHGNMYLKLRALEEATGDRTDDFYQQFLKNRRKSEIIANMLGRVYVNYSYEGLKNAVSKIKEVFVDEAEELRNKFQEIVEKTRRGG